MTDLGIASSIGQRVDKAAPRSSLTRVDTPAGFKLVPYKNTLPTLPKFEVKSLLLQLAYAETNFDYTADAGNKLGRYLLTNTNLQTAGYLDQDAAWTGLNEINDKAEFLSDYRVQDIVMQVVLEEYFDKLCRNTGIRVDDTKEIAAGMLAVAYQFRELEDPALKAAEWRRTGAVKDLDGNPGYMYYNYGRYAIVSIAADVTT